METTYKGRKFKPPLISNCECKEDGLAAELKAERDNGDRLAKALQIAVDELCGQLHGPKSAVFEGAFDALQQHEARRRRKG